MAPQAPRTTRRTAMVNGVTAVTLVVMLAVLALVAQPPSPPAIAEFAPQAQQQIEEAPQEESAESGAGAAGARETVVIEETDVAGDGETAQDVVTIEGVPSALQCFSWPDGSVTQTFDPQSPPCIATWDSDAGNGGATWQGVTDTEIRIAWPGYPGDDFTLALLDFVNTRYQLYGRRIVPVATTTGHAPEEQRAGAEEAIAADVFAAFDSPSFSAVNGPYVRRLAREGIVALLNTGTEMSQEEIESYGPLIWAGLPIVHHQWNLAADFVCTSLAGRPARLAADPELQDQTRVFAIVQGDGGDGQVVDTAYLEELLQACGVKATSHVVPYTLDDPAPRYALMNQLRLDGVTSVIIPGVSVSLFHADASAVGYRPEWIGDGYGVQVEFLGSANDQNAFGLHPGNKGLPPQFDMSHRAAAESDPSSVKGRIVFPSDRFRYRYLRLLAAGLQTAGPNLTPETFARGLRTTEFPNPGVGQHPFFQGSIGFDHSRSYIDDVALWWWNSQTTETYNNRREPGLPCLLRKGARFDIGSMPADDSEFYGPPSDC